MDAYIKHNQNQISVSINGEMKLFQVEDVDAFILENGLTGKEIQNIPSSVSRRQLRQALVLANIPLANIDYAISQIPDATEKTLMEIYWNDSTEFDRNHPKLIEFSQALNISENQADQLFILASTL